VTNISEPPPLIPAATVMLLRDHQGHLEVLMLRRNRQLKSFGGAWVFPGGRVDETDGLGLSEIERAKAAAIRETMEETGLDIAGADMATLSCWIPPVQEKRRFSTWFFIVRAPDFPVQIDQGEIHDYQWVCPRDFIAKIPSPDIMIMPPTFVSLKKLTEHSSVDDVLSNVHTEQTDIFETRFMKSSKGFVTLWKPDVAYDSLDLEAAGQRHRLCCYSDNWDYQRD
jgi:8-oxo-dGTP pyrophosphatase MutT (NUDIX family)